MLAAVGLDPQNLCVGGRRAPRMSFMATKKFPAQLIDSGGVKRCSICNLAFSTDAKLSPSVAFRQHAEWAHKLDQKTEEVERSPLSSDRGSKKMKDD
jgi:hypothetical protein